MDVNGKPNGAAESQDTLCYSPWQSTDLWRYVSTASSFISEKNILSKTYFSNNAVKPLCPPKAEPI